MCNASPDCGRRPECLLLAGPRLFHSPRGPSAGPGAQQAGGWQSPGWSRAPPSLGGRARCSGLHKSPWVVYSPAQLVITAWPNIDNGSPPGGPLITLAYCRVGSVRCFGQEPKVKKGVGTDASTYNGPRKCWKHLFPDPPTHVFPTCGHWGKRPHPRTVTRSRPGHRSRLQVTMEMRCRVPTGAPRRRS